MHSNFPTPSENFMVSTHQLSGPCQSDSQSEDQPEESHLVVTPRHLGLGRDMIIGGPGGPHYRVIDLSRLSEAVVVDWTGPKSGSITDGADSLVFHGVEEIILPSSMQTLPRVA